MDQTLAPAVFDTHTIEKFEVGPPREKLRHGFLPEAVEMQSGMRFRLKQPLPQSVRDHRVAETHAGQKHLAESASVQDEVAFLRQGPHGRNRAAPEPQFRRMIVFEKDSAVAAR